MAFLIVFFCIAAVIITALFWGMAENRTVRTTELRPAFSSLPAAFEGFAIVQLSDLHNARFGKEQNKLLSRIRAASPDVIVVTGDLIDKRRAGMKNALRCMERAVRIAPVWYVTGNHEAKSKEYPALRTALEALGVGILCDRCTTLRRGDAYITLAGLSDVRFFTNDKTMFPENVYNRLKALLPEDAAFTVLLAHRPELFSAYRAAGADLTLCGHAHGGQFRLPLVGGVVAPEQGLFPKYTKGIYEEAGKVMIVSRGLGNSSVPIRLNNPPEVVRIVLTQKK